jgi:hypothetical protein
MNPTYIGDPVGTGSNLTPIPESNVPITRVPNPNAADGQGVITGAPDYIDYPGPPTVVPPALANIVVDVNGQQWQYYQGGWH